MPRKDAKVAKRIRDRKDKWDKYWRINRTAYYEWVDFIMGDQWKEDESRLFERYNKIPLTFNKLGVLMNHLLGDQIQNTPALQINPEEGVPPETADIRKSLIKDISLNSDAKSVYETAFGQSIVGGFSAVRVGTEYLNNMSFDQEIKIYDFEDPCRCYWDISAKTKTKTDGMFCGYAERMSRKKFRSIYGKDIEQRIGSSAITEDSTLAFADDDSITIIYDYERKGENITIYKLSNGRIIDTKEFNSLEKVTTNDFEMIMDNGEAVSILQKRETTRYKIKHREIAGDFVLEETEFPSEQLPILFLDQKSYYTKQGQQIIRSFFKDVKDAQRFLNYLATQIAYILKVSRYDQFLVSRANVAAPDTQQIWRDPSVMQGGLVYDESPNGNKPEQLRPPELSQSLTQQYERALMDIQSGTGMYNTQIGEMGNEVSGTAIDRRTRRGSVNTRVPSRSLNILITNLGEIINEMIPKVYDTKRTLTLDLPHAQNQAVTINEMVDDYGNHLQNDMTKGRYKIRLMPGPGYEGQKEEALDSLQMVLNADKSGQVFPMIADLYAENLPLPNNIEIRNRLRTLVSPEIIEAGKTGRPLPPKPPQPMPDMIMLELKKQELQQKEAQAQREYEMKMKDLQLKQAEIQRKALETQQDMTMEWERLEAEKQEAAAELQETILRFNAEMHKTNTDAEMNHANNLVKILTHSKQHEPARTL